MNRRVLAAVSIFLLVLIGLAVVEVQDSQDTEESMENTTENTTESQAENSAENRIVFTGSGFHPEDLTIEKGETVFWDSNTSESMWIASDPYPAHTGYSDTSMAEHCNSQGEPFDQCSTGEQFNFTFDKEGTFGYHNHQPFVQGGEIIVE